MRAVILGAIAASQLSAHMPRPVPRPPQVEGPLPWLHGVTDVDTTEGTPGAAADPTSECPADAPLRLVGDVAPAAGRETVTATLGGGIRVTAAEGQELAATRGYPCDGSADALGSLSIGRIFGEPVIVLAVTTGGHREQMTWLGVYRVGPHGAIDALFAGAVETNADGVVHTGRVTFVPGALIYHPPGAGDSLWVFDPVVRTYLPRGPFGHEAEPHS